MKLTIAGRAALLLALVSVPACDTKEAYVPKTVTIPFEYTVRLDTEGEFSESVSVDEAMEEHKLSNATGLTVHIQSIDYSWQPDASNTAQTADFAVTSSFGYLTENLDITLESAGSSWLVIDDEDRTLRSLRRHIAEVLIGSPQNPNQTVGVTGDTNGGRAAGTMTVRILITASWQSCETVWILPAPMENPDLPPCEKN